MTINHFSDAQKNAIFHTVAFGLPILTLIVLTPFVKGTPIPLCGLLVGLALLMAKPTLPTWKVVALSLIVSLVALLLTLNLMSSASVTETKTILAYNLDVSAVTMISSALVLIVVAVLYYVIGGCARFVYHSFMVRFGAAAPIRWFDWLLDD